MEKVLEMSAYLNCFLKTPDGRLILYYQFSGNRLITFYSTRVFVQMLSNGSYSKDLQKKGMNFRCFNHNNYYVSLYLKNKMEIISNNNHRSPLAATLTTYTLGTSLHNYFQIFVKMDLDFIWSC